MAQRKGYGQLGDFLGSCDSLSVVSHSISCIFFCLFHLYRVDI
uniref:Uncharacterized protein n=1 Tax=Arundo donax TaxID=35708 RepID=A0A0A9C6A7_ARUDO